MIKQPQQARSRETRAKLLRALETQLKERDFDHITVTDIAKSAGVSNGLLYSHFKNKIDFLEALIGIYKQRIIDRLEVVESEDLKREYLNAGNLREALRDITRFAYAQVEEDTHIIRAIFTHFRNITKTDHTEWNDLRDRASKTIAEVVYVYKDDVLRKDIDVAAKMLVYFYNSIFLDRFLTGTVGTPDHISYETDEFIDEITDFAFGYLTTP